MVAGMPVSDCLATLCNFNATNHASGVGLLGNQQIESTGLPGNGKPARGEPGAGE